MSEKEHAHQLLDQLDSDQLAAVVRLLEVMSGPVARSLATALIEDEEIAPTTAAELDHARASIDRGEGIPHEEILREFRLKPRP